jgi:hypothetical protein
VGFTTIKRKNMATIKGQNLRILQGFDADDLKCVAAATSCTVHISLSVEEDTTKDTVDDWITNIPSSINWDVEVSALVYGDPNDDTATPITDLIVGRTYVLKFSRTAGSAGEKNRDAVYDDITYIGQAILNDYSTTAQNNNIATATAKFTGTGDLSHPEQENS